MFVWFKGKSIINYYSLQTPTMIYSVGIIHKTILQINSNLAFTNGRC